MIRTRLRKVLMTAGLAAFVSVGIAPANAAPAQRVSIKTDWGIVSVPVVKAPKSGKCVNIKVKIDVKNAANVPDGGINVLIIDDFDNIVALTKWGKWELVDGKVDFAKPKPNGIYTETMTPCAKPGVWVNPTRTDDTAPLVAAKAKESYVLSIVETWERILAGEADYVWKK